MAVSRAAERGRDPAHRALAGDGASGVDDRIAGDHGDGAGARICVFPRTVLADDRIPGACGGGDGAGARASTIHPGVSIGGAWRGYCVADADFDVRARAARAVLFVFRIRDGGGGVPLGIVGNGEHRGGGGGAVVDRGDSDAGRAGGGDRPLAGASSLAAARDQYAGTESATADHEFGVPAGAGISAGLHGAEPEKNQGRTRCDYARAQFHACGRGTDGNDAADSR